MIVTAYAAGDRRQLKDLLGREVYEGFESAIRDREQRGETVETRFVSIDAADLIGAEMERAEANPLRILDSKRGDWSEMLERAPQLGEYLSDESAAHFARVQEGLQALGIPFEISPRLVRGFDYYPLTTFEFQSTALDAAQNALGGGGRYDGLAEEMGGPSTPGIGFGAGIERLVARYDLDNDDALAYLERRLRGIGVIRALQDEGFEPGDEVEIAGIAFDLDPDV